jgi:DNA-binding FrmR family transcriptional regulator
VRIRAEGSSVVNLFGEVLLFADGLYEIERGLEPVNVLLLVDEDFLEKLVSPVVVLVTTEGGRPVESDRLSVPKNDAPEAGAQNHRRRAIKRQVPISDPRSARPGMDGAIVHRRPRRTRFSRCKPRHPPTAYPWQAGCLGLSRFSCEREQPIATRRPVDRYYTLVYYYLPGGIKMAHTVREKKKLLNRVRRIRGQVDAVEKALEAEDDCALVIQTIAAARGALNGLMAELLEGHVREHLIDTHRKPTRAQLEAADVLVDVVRAYLK